MTFNPKVITLWAFRDFKKNLKILLQPVGKFYTVGVILTNIHNCYNRNMTSFFFDLEPFAIQEYLVALQEDDGMDEQSVDLLDEDDGMNQELECNEIFDK